MDNGITIILNLDEDMRLSMFFDEISIDEVSSEEVYETAVHRMKRYGIDENLIISYDIEPC